MAENQQHNIRSAEHCIWYVLATVAGVAVRTHDASEADTIMKSNQYYWNGLMRERMLLTGGGFESRLGYTIDLPELTNEDHDTIRAALDARGFEGVSIPYYQSTIDFSRVDFPESSWFHGFVFGGDASFDGARFNGSSNRFTNVIFGGTVTFSGTNFFRSFYCDDAHFMVFSSFDRAKFRGAAWFRRAMFHDRANFERAQFSADAHFENCEFSDVASFVGAVFENRSDFRVARFRGRTNFEKASFKAAVPEFFGATLNEHTEWHDTEWPEIPNRVDDQRDQITRYQCLVRSMHNLQKFSDQHFFFRKELQIQRRIERFSLATPLNWAYQHFCDYGNGLTRMVVLWLTHMVVGAVALSLAKICDGMDNATLWQATRTAFPDFPLAFALSFGNAHGPLGLNGMFFEDAIEEWPWYGVVGPLQTVFGVIILFFLLLTIRNRFRMR